jgi:hypothetical protein
VPEVHFCSCHIAAPDTASPATTHRVPSPPGCPPVIPGTRSASRRRRAAAGSSTCPGEPSYTPAAVSRASAADGADTEQRPFKLTARTGPAKVASVKIPPGIRTRDFALGKLCPVSLLAGESARTASRPTHIPPAPASARPAPPARGTASPATGRPTPCPPGSVSRPRWQSGPRCGIMGSGHTQGATGPRYVALYRGPDCDSTGP